MQIIHKSDQKFEDLWQRFLNENSHISPFYQRNWMRYQVAYSEEKLLEDLSFIIVDNLHPVAICPLYLEKYNDSYFFSYRGEYLKTLRAPIIRQNLKKKAKKKLRAYIFRYLDELAKIKKVKKCTFIIDPLTARDSSEDFNYLQQYGFIDASMTTSIIDLNESEESHRTNLRKSFKSIINKSLREFEHVVMDHTNYDHKIFKDYVEMHHKAAGRVTRPEETFELQAEMIRNNEGVLIGLKKENSWRAFGFFLHNSFSAYYASGSLEPDYVMVTDAHLIQWLAINFYKNMGLQRLELDNQYFGPQIFENPSDKEINISKFKRGFGGEMRPLYRGIKFYDKDLLKDEMNENIRLFIHSYEETLK